MNDPNDGHGVIVAMVVCVVVIAALAWGLG